VISALGEEELPLNLSNAGRLELPASQDTVVGLFEQFVLYDSNAFEFIPIRALLDK